MCAINGIYAYRGSPVDMDLLVRMRDSMTRRGPDASGLWRREGSGNVGLGHRRLSIVDLTEHGHQPMANEDGSVVVTFNGEIYNHVSLRAELERRGHRFRSRCDTEVLVHLYEEHGPEMADHLSGMFAFAIWDERQQSLLLARDRLGIKPLYFTERDGSFAFASEIKALLALVPERSIDPVALSHYLTFVAVPPPRTMFAGIHKLAAGHTMVVNRDGPQAPRRYWDALEYREQVGVDEVDWAAELRFRLERSVDRHLMSDVPVGIFLSGGVDSSTNVALMSQLVQAPVNTFSIGYRGESEFNEFVHARRIAERFATNHHELTIDADDLWRFMPELVVHQDEPIADPVCVPLYFVSQLAKESGVTVVHVGEGADEILAGYPTYVTANRMATGPWPLLRSLPRPARRALAAAGGLALRGRPDLEIHREALLRSAQPAAHLWWGGAVAFYEAGLGAITTDAFRRSLDGPTPADVVAGIAADASQRGARDALDALIYQDLRLRLPELLLMRVDKLTMANSIEARVPFLDHEVVELAMAMPEHEKIQGRVGKHVLKRAVADLLPHDLIWRRKQGFGAPVAEWFRGPLAHELSSQLLDASVLELGYLERSRIETLLSEHRAGRADRSFQLWNLLNLSVWFDHWIAGAPAPAEQAMAGHTG